MRARSLKQGIFKNEILGQADPILTLLFEGLWCLADRLGRLEDRPLRIKAEIFPYRDLPDFNRYLTDLARLGFIQRYEAGGQSLIYLPTFLKHQSPHKTERPSVLPGITDGCLLPVNPPLDNDGNPPDSLVLTPDSLTHDSPPTPAIAVAITPGAPKGKRKSWQLNFDPDVLEAAARIMDIWPNSSKSQPEKGKTVPASKGPEVAKRLQRAKAQGKDIGICIAIAERFVGEFDRGGMWAKAAENFFGPSEDAPWHSYYAIEVYNRMPETSDLEVAHAS